MNTPIKMRIGERGQVVIPKELRERYGLLPNTEAEFVEEKGRILVRPAAISEPSHQDAWDEVWGLLQGRITDVDDEVEEMRGR